MLTGFDFILGAYASRAQLQLFGFTIHHDRSRMYIWDKPPVSMSFGMANIFAKNGSFPTDIALQFAISFDFQGMIL
jgi:hypothetical protein